MSAQRELAELLSRQCKTLDDGRDLRHDKARWLTDHGPAIAELIAAASDEYTRMFLTSMPLKHEFRAARGMKDIEEVHEWMSGVAKRFNAALAKLTEPKE
jgi:hypothetical protein